MVTIRDDKRICVMLKDIDCGQFFKNAKGEVCLKISDHFCASDNIYNFETKCLDEQVDGDFALPIDVEIRVL